MEVELVNNSGNSEESREVLVRMSMETEKMVRFIDLCIRYGYDSLDIQSLEDGFKHIAQYTNDLKEK